MREYNLNEQERANLPREIGVWGKVKNFLFQEIDLMAPVVLELTPKEEKVLSDVHDFLFQEVNFSELHDFLFQEVNFKPIHDFLFQEITFGKKNK
ncbi:MAG: hypothetical protein ACI4UE_01705 [Candidatus Scatovivens sp.]